LGNIGERSLPMAFDRMVKFLFYQENFYEEFGRHVKTDMETGNSLHREPPLGNLEGVRLPGLFERQMEDPGKGASLINLTWAPFLDPDYVRSSSLWAIWNFCEGPGLP